MDIVKQRLTDYCQFKDISAREFSRIVGLSAPYLSSPGSVSSDVLEQLSIKFPDLNLEWVITGKGEMIKQESLLPEHILRQLINPADTQDIMNLGLPVEDTLIVLRNEISMLKQEIKVRDELIASINKITTKTKKKP